MLISFSPAAFGTDAYGSFYFGVLTPQFQILSSVSLGAGCLWRENVCDLNSWNHLQCCCKAREFRSHNSVFRRVLSTQKIKWWQYVRNGDEKTTGAQNGCSILAKEQLGCSSESHLVAWLDLEVSARQRESVLNYIRLLGEHSWVSPSDALSIKQYWKTIQEKSPRGGGNK